MSSAQLSDAQTRLRTACQTGDITAVQAALGPQQHTWRKILWHWLRGLKHGSAGSPAELIYVYEDDQCNLPVHYLATGALASRFVCSDGEAQRTKTFEPTCFGDVAACSILS